MAKAKNGDKVSVHYTGKLADGEVFDSSQGRDPLEFELGSGSIIPGFEKAVMGLQPGEAVTTVIPSDEAYGPHREDLVLEVGRDMMPPDLKPEIGQQLQMSSKDGRTTPVYVVGVDDKNVKLDANHPLAGKELTFEIELVEIQ
ncbi:MAG: peptidylprolyl isomerase [Deferribacteres bacterium]|nr:peptidylprolyl isomerase [candidate division KSB1 bacterium]MCB9511829.1 peptidylprolyl isomerase [Deferribacteres bacterium]